MVYWIVWCLVFTVTPIVAHSLGPYPLAVAEPVAEPGESQDTKCTEEPSASVTEGDAPIIQTSDEEEMSALHEQFPITLFQVNSEGPPLLERSFSLNDIKPTKTKVLL